MSQNTWKWFTITPHKTFISRVARRHLDRLVNYLVFIVSKGVTCPLKLQFTLKASKVKLRARILSQDFCVVRLGQKHLCSSKIANMLSYIFYMWSVTSVFQASVFTALCQDIVFVVVVLCFFLLPSSKLLWYTEHVFSADSSDSWVQD